MPLIQGIRKNPLDLNKNVKVGVAFPLDENNLFSGTDTLIDQAKSNLINLLLTHPGERVNLPDFGIGLKRLLFEQKIDLKSLRTKIQAQTEFYIPNITVTNVLTSLSNDEHTLFVTIQFVSLLDNSVDAIQLDLEGQSNTQTGNY